MFLRSVLAAAAFAAAVLPAESVFAEGSRKANQGQQREIGSKVIEKANALLDSLTPARRNEALVDYRSR